MSAEQNPLDALESLLDDSSQSDLDVPLFAAALEEIQKIARAAVSTCQERTAAAVRQASALVHVADQLVLLSSRDPDVRSSLSRLREGLERSRVAAINAGLDGARQGEAGRGLVALADEIRTHLTRGLDAFDEHTALLGELEREFGAIGETLSALRAEAASLHDGAFDTQTEYVRLQLAIERMMSALRGSRQFDAEAAHWMAKATEHIAGLRQALRVLGADAGRVAGLTELLPALEQARTPEPSEQ